MPFALFADVAPAGGAFQVGLLAVLAAPFLIGFGILAALYVRRKQFRQREETRDDA
jgi:hypothetical protein